MHTGRWNPHWGYGFFCLSSLDIGASSGALETRSILRLLKLHGSINWRPKLGYASPVAKSMKPTSAGKRRTSTSPRNVSVKSGHVTVRDIRDLRGTLNDKKDVGGVFVTRQPATRPMREFVNTSEVVQLELSPTFPKLQILTLDEILNGERPVLPYAYAA